MHCRNFSACRVRSVPVQRSDFHLGADDDADDREPKDLFIDVLIGLPELADGTATPQTSACRSNGRANRGSCEFSLKRYLGASAS